jgi:hypothetical protein
LPDYKKLDFEVEPSIKDNNSFEDITINFTSREVYMKGARREFIEDKDVWNSTLDDRSWTIDKNGWINQRASDNNPASYMILGQIVRSGTSEIQNWK